MKPSPLLAILIIYHFTSVCTAAKLNWENKLIELNSPNKHTLIVKNISPATLQISFQNAEQPFLLKPFSYKEFPLSPEMRRNPSITIEYNDSQLKKDKKYWIGQLSKFMDYDEQLDQILEDTKNFEEDWGWTKRVIEEYGIEKKNDVNRITENIHTIQEIHKGNYNKNLYANSLNTISYKNEISSATITNKFNFSIGFPIKRPDYNEYFLKENASKISYDLQLSYMLLGDYILSSNKNLFSVHGFLNWNVSSYGLDGDRTPYYAGGIYLEEDAFGLIDRHDFVNLNFQQLSLGGFARYSFNNRFNIDIGGGFNAYNNVQLHFDNEEEKSYDETHINLPLKKGKFNQTAKYSGDLLYGLIQIGFTGRVFFAQFSAEFNNQPIATTNDDYQLHVLLEGDNLELVPLKPEDVLPVSFKLKFGISL